MNKMYPDWLEIPDWGGDLEAQRVEYFESILHYKLPEQYRNYLLKRHGGKPTGKDSLYVDGFEEIVGICRMGVIHIDGINSYGGDHNDLIWFREELSENLPDELLVFADDGYGVREEIKLIMSLIFLERTLWSIKITIKMSSFLQESSE